MPTYTRVYPAWHDAAAGGTPLDAAAVQHLEDGIVALYAQTRVLIPTLLPSDNNAQAWPDAALTTKAFVFEVPANYASGNLSVKLHLRQGSATGTVVFARSVNRFRDATAVNTLESNVAMNQTLGDTNTHVVTVTVSSANFQVGDTFRADFVRDGANASDTMAANLVLDGIWVEYTGS